MQDREEFQHWTDKMIAETEYWVEATDYESLCLWRQYGEDNPGYKWEQVSRGCVEQLGVVMDNMPVNLSISWAYLNGHLIAFYDACSMVVDYRLVEKFLEGKRSTNAMNFHNCVHALEEKNDKIF